MFVTENVQTAPLLRCPHCRSEAPPRQFHYMPLNDPFDAGKEDGMPALLSAIEHLDDDDTREKPEAREHETEDASEPFRLKGKWMHFDCPHCQWPLRLKAAEAESSLMDCGHCGLELMPPDPATGAHARLTRASAEQISRISSADMRSVRLGRGQAQGQSVMARADRRPAKPVKFEQIGDTSILSSASATKPAPKKAVHSKTPEKNSVKPLAPEQLGRAFTPFEDQTIIGGPEFELNESEIQENAHRQRLLHARIFRYIVISAIVILAAAAVFMQMQIKEEKAAAIINDNALEAKVALATAEDQRIQDMFDTARELAAAEDWHAFIPKLRHRSRVEPILNAYYAENPHTPVTLVSYDKPVSVQVDGFKYEQMTVRTDVGKTLIVGFQHDPEGLTFDWEVFVDIADWEWANFKNTKSTAFIPVRVVVMRTSADDQYYRDAGFSREEAIAVRIWLRDRADSYIAIIRKDSPIGQQVDHECKWEIGKLIIADLAFPAAEETNRTDRLLLRRIVQDRWLYSAKD